MASKLEIIEVLRSKSNQQLFTAFKQSIENREVVVLLGMTRSGKSTLANYLMKNTLCGTKVRPGIIKIECDDPNGPAIGKGSLSCTSVPLVYILSTGIAMVDVPGFEDNRGVEQEILNIVFNYQIKFAKNIKLILVCDIADISNDNISNFISSLKFLSKFVTNYQELVSSFAVVFTKDRDNYTQQDVAEALKEKILDPDDLVANKELVQNFVNNKNLIGIFKMPVKEGQINKPDDLAVNINDAIASCQAAPFSECQINVATSETLRNNLLEIAAEYTGKNLFKEAINTIIDIEPHKNYFNIEDYVIASTAEELKEEKTELNVIIDRLKSEIKNKMSRINDIKLSLNNLNVLLNINEELYSIVSLLLCLDDFSLLEEYHRSLIIKNYQQDLKELEPKVTAVIDKIIEEEQFRTDNNIVFGLHGVGFGLGAAATGVAVFAGEALALGTLGTVATGGVGLLVMGGVTVSTYIRYRDTCGKRNEARKNQGRD